MTVHILSTCCMRNKSLIFFSLIFVHVNIMTDNFKTMTNTQEASTFTHTIYKNRKKESVHIGQDS